MLRMIACFMMMLGLAACAGKPTPKQPSAILAQEIRASETGHFAVFVKTVNQSPTDAMRCAAAREIVSKYGPDKGFRFKGGFSQTTAGPNTTVSGLSDVWVLDDLDGAPFPAEKTVASLLAKCEQDGIATGAAS